MKKIVSFFISILFFFNISFAQRFTHADTLRGSNGYGRAWWDATKYDLHIKFNVEDSSITGYNVISFEEITKRHAPYFQIDLQEPMIIDSVILGDRSGSLNKRLNFTRDGNAWFISLKAASDLVKGDVTHLYSLPEKESELVVYYHGKPHQAKNAPWDGGFVWKRDEDLNPWISIACQGLGASVWYPCKDYQGDEPDSAEMHFTSPPGLVAVSNGRLRSIKKDSEENNVYAWSVENSINNYGITFYIGNYVHFDEIYKGEKGDLSMDYWVLKSHLSKAKEQFKDVLRMMKVFEYWFGPYPFYEDGYKLVDAPYLGMEHQSAIGYGNHYKNGYDGRDLSGSGWGLKWDFIIVHESAHEWFGNSITANDIADMWVQEGFANYAETLYTEYYYGKKAATDYVVGIRKNILNDKPIIGHYGVNDEGSGDMYYKAGNMIHMIRQIINDDEKFRKILRGMNENFYHQTVTSKQIEDYINQQSGINFSKVFDQYLRTTDIPQLQYKKKAGKIYYRWINCVDGFNMPVKIYNKNGELIFIHPTTKFQSLHGKQLREISVDENFYVNVEEVN